MPAMEHVFCRERRRRLFNVGSSSSSIASSRQVAYADAAAAISNKSIRGAPHVAKATLSVCSQNTCSAFQSPTVTCNVSTIFFANLSKQGAIRSLSISTSDTLLPCNVCCKDDNRCSGSSTDSKFWSVVARNE